MQDVKTSPSNSPSRLRIVLGNDSLADYQQGGGHWTVRVQYLLGLHSLGHDVFLMAILWSAGDRAADDQRINSFFARLHAYDLDERAMLLVYGRQEERPDLASARIHGRTRAEAEELMTTADMLWDDCGHVPQPLLSMFRHRVLIDLDPGHLQVSASSVEIAGLNDHETFLSIGGKLHDADCEVPTLGLTWHTFTPFVYLPMWRATAAPGARAPFTSVTHWTWGGDLPWRGGLLSISKRDAYLRYLDLPRRAGRPFELAVNIRPEDTTGDRELLESRGWKIVDPWEVAGSPGAYQRYLSSSRAEILCPKPVFRELKTGWFSDRSACYLASGRPVLMEETGVSDCLPTGKGLVTFTDMSEAVARVAEIDSHYAAHAKAARELAEEYLDSARVLPGMLSACG